MRIAFVANRYFDPRVRGSWSGLPYFIKNSLEQAGVEVETCVLDEPSRGSGVMRYAYWRFACGRRYMRACEAGLLMHYAREATRRLAEIRPDAVFCPSSWPVAYLRADVPTVFWTDACFAGMLDFYESFSNLAPVNVADGHAAEFAALSSCARAIYSSPWAAASARASYSADPSKVRIVPFGANITDVPSIGAVEGFVSRRELRRCELLLIGVDWRRKGASIAVEAVKSLNERGLPSRLTILGCEPPRGDSLPPFVEIAPFIDKETPEGARRFSELCRRSHFLLMPSRADCTPVAISEGNHFGLPCLASAVGGIPSMISEGENGMLFELRAPGSAYAEQALRLMRDPARYRALAVGSAAHAHSHSSWRASGAKVASILAEVVNARKQEGVRPPPMSVVGT